ncbi:helix-turn-helix domain-containing protein [Ignavibacteria bacterium 4148-Me]|uniref:helix-turn-helix domain-containing protein n=1 Tax=Rosettibacter primus TaxID=3111523 RepID=UPI00336C099B
MASEALIKFAEELKFIRVEKGISLQQISNHTKIDIKFLQKIEEGDFNFLPEIYVKAFIKEYAQTLELDPYDVIKKFVEAKNKIADSRVIQQEESKTIAAKRTGEKTLEPESIEKKYKKEFDAEEYFSPELEYLENNQESNSKRKYFLYAGIAVIFLIAVYILFIKGDSNIIEEKPYEDVLTDRYEIDSSITEQKSLQRSDSLNLSITPVKLVWLKVLCDNKEVYRQMAPAEKVLNFKAQKEFYVVVGNAGHVKMSLNNKPIAQIGNLGEIRNYYISVDTIRSYLIPVPKKDEKESTTKN